MHPQLAHITRKRGVYYYRRRLPSRLGGEEVSLSLRTKYFRRAEWLAMRLAPAFQHICRVMPPQVDIQKIAADYLRERLEFDMDSRIASPNSPLYGIPYDPDDTPEECDVDWLLGELKDAKYELANRKYESQRPLIDELMETHAVPEESRSALAHGILRARVELWETVLKRTRGDFDRLGVDLERPLVPTGDQVRRTDDDRTEAPTGASPVTGPRLSEVLPAYVSFMVEHKGWRGQTKAQSEATFRMFQAHCGDKPIQMYTRLDLTSFYDLLRQLPALYAKKAEWKDMPLAEIVRTTAGASCERMTMKTVKRHFSALGALFTYLKRRGEYSGENPAHGFDYPDKVRAKQKRDMWEGELLTKLFNSPVWAGCRSEGRRTEPGELILKDEKYWLPLLGLYHGNRLEEFAQLLRGDVQREGDIYYFDVNDEDTKQLKNAQSRRRVPIHPAIIDLGFLQYLDSLGQDSTAQVFPNLVPGGPDNKLGYSFSKWFSRYRREVGVYRKGLDYHSFRHGVTTKLYAADVHEHYIDELTGHEGGGTGRQVYKKAMPLEKLHEAISKIEWREVFSVLFKQGRVAPE